LLLVSLTAANTIKKSGKKKGKKVFGSFVENFTFFLLFFRFVFSISPFQNLTSCLSRNLEDYNHLSTHLQGYQKGN
jgi:hypothetical protein